MEPEHNIPILINQFIATDSSLDSDSNQSTKYAEELSQLLIDGKLTLLQFITELGPYLTSDKDIVRSKALTCLSSTSNQLILQLATNTLSKQDIVVLIDFLLGKFDDKVCLQEVLVNINNLVQFKNFIPSLVVTKILSSIIENYNPKKHLAKIRYQVFSILQSLLNFHRQYFISNIENSNLFIRAFISIAEGEKDPRNLLISFEINTNINQTFTFDPKEDLHKQYINDLFDICFCYFPISFTPPANDPYKITSQQLKVALTKTISSQSLFTPDSFNNLLEKLTSTNPMVRNDVLSTLLTCLELYNLSTIEQYWITIWNSIKFELLHRNDSTSIFKPELFELIPENYNEIDDNDDSKSLILALIIIQTISRRLSDLQNGNLEFVTTVFNDLQDSLIKIDGKSKPSILIFAALASQSNTSFDFIVKRLFNFDIWGRFINVDQEQKIDQEIDTNEDLLLNVEKQRDLVDLFGFIFSAYHARSVDQSFRQENALIEFKSHLLVFIGQLFKSSSNVETTLKIKIFQQFFKLIQLPEFLNSSEIELIFQYFNEILNSDQINWNDAVVQELLTGLIQISEFSPRLLIEYILPHLLSKVQDTNCASTNQLLKFIGDICTSYQILEVLSIRFISILQNSSDQTLIQLVIEMFIDLVKKIETRSQFLTNSWLANFVPCIIKLHHNNPILVERIGDLVGLIVRFTDINKHQSIIDQFNNQFNDVLKDPRIEMGIYCKIVANIDRNVTNSSGFKIESYIELTKSINDEYIRIVYLQFLSLSVNKFVSVEDNLNLLFTKAREGNDLEIFIWILKGLLLKLDKSGLEYLNKLIELNETTTDYQLKQLISRSLMILFVDLPIFTNQLTQIKIRDLISKVNNYNVKLLYKQHIFEIIFPHLINGKDKVYLQSLSLILDNLGNQAILKPHLSEILPSILQSLSTNDAVMIKSSLSTLKIIIEQDITLITPHLTTIMPVLNKLIAKKVIKNHKQVNNESIRLTSLQILSLLFEHVNNTTIIIYKNDCLATLAIALDDNKRSVRKACADLRQVLFEL